MIEQLEKVKMNADNISSVLSRKKSSLRGIKLERKRLLLKKSNDKKRERAEKKLEAKKSPFGKSLFKIKKSTSTNSLFKNLGGNLLQFVSLLLLGVAINNIEEIKESLDKAFKRIKEGFKTISDVIKTVYDKTEDFINMFNNDPKKECNYEKLENEVNEADSLTKKLSSMLGSINEVLNKASGTSFGSTIDSGTLPTGETYDIINVFDKDKGDIPIIRVKELDGIV